MRPIDADTLYEKAEENYKTASGFYRPIYKGLMDDIADAPTIATPPNDPLTMEELREMGGEPVWVTTSTGVRPFVGIVDTESNIVFFGLSSDTSYGGQVPLNCYGEFWLAYRRKPEEEAT